MLHSRQFLQVQATTSFVTCTDQLQQWNRPRPKKVKPTPVKQLKFRKLEYGKQKTTCTKPLSSQYDPRPLKYRHTDKAAVTELHKQLAEVGTACGILDLLGPVVDKPGGIRHDHTYTQASDYPNQFPPQHTVVPPLDSESFPQLPKKEEMSYFKQGLMLTTEQAAQVEKDTRGQYTQTRWFDHRRHRITASVCGKVLQKSTRAVVREILYPKPLLYLPAPISWGRKYEHTASVLYEEKMSSETDTLVCTRDCGLFIQPRYGWLAATPDATVHITQILPAYSRSNVPMHAGTMIYVTHVLQNHFFVPLRMER